MEWRHLLFSGCLPPLLLPKFQWRYPRVFLKKFHKIGWFGKADLVDLQAAIQQQPPRFQHNPFGNQRLGGLPQQGLAVRAQRFFAARQLLVFATMRV